MAEILSERYLASTFAHDSATVAGTIYEINSTVVMALNDADADDDNVFVHQADKIKVTKNSGEAWTVGDRIYWDDGNSRFTTTASTHTLAGYVAEPAESADTEGKIVLTPWLDAA